MNKTESKHARTPELCTQCRARIEIEVEMAEPGRFGVAFRWCPHTSTFADIRFKDRVVTRWELAGPVDEAFVALRMQALEAGALAVGGREAWNTGNEQSH